MTDEGILADERDDGFIYFSFSGERFDAPGMPAGSAVEVQRLSELIYEVARHVWLQENPDRRRVPSEFVQALDLRLVAIDEGSARPVLRLARRDEPFEEEFEHIFARARDVIVDTLATVADSREIPVAFPREALPELRRLGKTLEGNESLTLGAPRPPGERRTAPQHVGVLDVEIRETIKTIDSALTAEPEAVTVTGVITEFDGEKGTFLLRSVDGPVRVCRLAYGEVTVAEVVKQALAPDGITAPDVDVFGQGMVGDDRVVASGIYDVTSVTVIRSFPEKILMRKLSSVSVLTAGWAGAGALAPDADTLSNLASVIPALALLDVPIAVGANGDGAVVLEWSRGNLEYTAMVEPGDELFLCVDDTETDEMNESQTHFDAATLVRFAETGQIDG